jgi:hypothetical protein
MLDATCRLRRYATLLCLLLALGVACRPEQRPGTVERIVPPGGTPYTGTVYGPGGLPVQPGAKPSSGTVYGPGGLPAQASTDGITPGEVYYTPQSNVSLYQLLSQDFQEIAQLTNAVNEGRPLPSAEILAIYQNAKHARVGSTSRQMRTFARAPARQQEFPDAARVHGSPTFLDDPVFQAIQGTGAAANYTPGQRRQAIQKGIQRILAYWMRQELLIAEMRLRDGNTGPTGAPQNIDEAWAIYMGTPQGTGFPSSLSATAVSREMNFKREGTVDRPLREALQRAQQAAAAGNMPDFQAARRDVESRLNALFYLASARYLNEAMQSAQASNADAAAVQQMEGLSFYATIQPKVATADAGADQAVVDYYRADPATLTPARRDETLAALNRAAPALGLSANDLLSPSDYQPS